MKRVALLIAMVALVAGSLALADEEKTTEETKVPAPAKMSGLELYKNYCKVCHGEDADAGEYTPMSLIMEQWDEFYDGVFAETHAKLELEAAGDDPLTKFSTKDMIKKLRKFCVDHAADSEQPMTCG